MTNIELTIALVIFLALGIYATIIRPALNKVEPFEAMQVISTRKAIIGHVKRTNEPKTITPIMRLKIWYLSAHTITVQVFHNQTTVWSDNKGNEAKNGEVLEVKRSELINNYKTK